MASSLEDLLIQEGFRHHKPRRPKSKLSDTPHPPPAPANICNSRKSVELYEKKDLPSFSSLNSGLDREQPLIDEVAVRAVVSILSSYAGRFSKDGEFRERVRERCMACLAVSKGAAHAVLTNLELGMDNIERLAGDPPGSKESKIRSLRNSIRLLSIVASLNSPRSKRNGFTCGVSNSHLSAIAQLYLAFVYRIERNDRLSSRHLLQMFCDAPFLARRNLLPNLWEHFFLPHLLHLKVWYAKEEDVVSGWDAEEKDHRLKMLSRVYNDSLDAGTVKFALYYKEWLNVGGEAPPLPSVPLPSRPESIEPVEMTSMVAISSSKNAGLYQAVFGSSLERDGNGDQVMFKLHEEKKEVLNRKNSEPEDSVHIDKGLPQRPSNTVDQQPPVEVKPEPRRSHSFRLYSCMNHSNKFLVHETEITKNKPARSKRTTPPKSKQTAPLPDLDQAIALLSDSNSLSYCKVAIRCVAKAWLDSHGDSHVKKALSTSSVIQGILDLLFACKDDEVLELAMSILAELIVMNEVNRQAVLNADPQLEIFLRLLRSDTLCLKGAVLLYMLKPKAKQMLSPDWMPTVLRVLECGDQPQTLFSVQSTPKLAAFYFLDQLLMGFDVDRNVENGKQLVALGGLDLLIRSLEIGEDHERRISASLLAKCVQAEGSCRDYLAANIKKASIIELLQGNQLKSDGIALSLLAELICLSRRTQITKFLDELKKEGFLNTMHILLVYLQQAPTEQRPLAAAILLQLDLLGDPLQYSVYREDAIDAIVAVMERNSHNKKVQEHCSRALLLLAGRFSSTGMVTAEAWLLKKAGLDDGPQDSFTSRELLVTDFQRMEEEERANETWLRNLAIVLLSSGHKRLLVALSNCIGDWIPNLARSCLVTIAWISCSISSSKGAHRLMSFACSILAPRLLESLNYDRALEERVLASLSLLHFAKQTDCLLKFTPFGKETTDLLKDLSRVTWTAQELLFACC
ncbi:Armadillo-like helical-containing protein [Dioscorea alata]|uniref:Armadillo-like helical-containing protein n=1 Tax=Dioscorea alata TaxID=55571 RepID=A0ACB7U2H8_DIOAL|nr:Armadillo-like helical-containing protein [Dioscorea alata]